MRVGGLDVTKAGKGEDFLVTSSSVPVTGTGAGRLLNYQVGGRLVTLCFTLMTSWSNS